MNTINVRSLSFQYDSVKALDTVSIDVPAGEIFGLIGPDGAGKTTLMRIICTLLKIETGSVQVLGYDVMQDIGVIRSLIGYMPQRFSLYQDLTVEQNLDFFARLFGVPTAELNSKKESLYRFSRLGSFKNRRAGALSGGMKQKLALSCALVHSPRILILDEPTYGVDPVSREEFWAILHDLSSSGTTIMVSTPYMEEALQCDQIAMIHKGRILGTGSPEDLIHRFGHRVYVLNSDSPKLLRDKVMNCDGVASCQMFGTNLHVTAKEENADLMQVLKSSIPIEFTWTTTKSGIEDIFLELMDDSRNA